MAMEQKTKVEEVTCYHCGEDCDHLILEKDDKSFCCEGCKMVYELLNENDMCAYYDLESSPGIRKDSDSDDKYNYLDHEDIVSKLLEFTEGEIAKVKLYVPKIHCSSCIWLLENLQKLHPGILHSQVNFLKKEVYITYNQKDVSLRLVVELLDRIGYVPQISLNDIQKKEKKKDKSFFYKLGIAGFAFGNIMLLSFPEYLDQQDYLDEQYKRLFGYLNLVLAAPVFFYSSSDYFISAWKALRTRFVNIDLPISLGIIALFLRSSYEILSGTGAGFMDSFTMFVFLLLVGKWYQGRTYKALSFDRDYTSYFPIAITRIKSGIEESIPLNQLKINDEILVRNKEIIPSDAILLSDKAVIDYSFVTGESTPVEKIKGDKLFAGGRQTGATVQVKIIKPVSQSYLTRLWNQDAFAKEETATNTLVNKVSKYFTMGVIVVATATLVFWLFRDESMAINAFTSVLIIACPCALALTVPFTLGNIMRILGRHLFYLKNTDTVEKLAEIDTIVFDKTGTITESVGSGVRFEGTPLKEEELNTVLALVKHSTHPLSQTIYQHYRKEERVDVIAEGFEEFTGKGVVAHVAGVEVKVGSAEFTQANRLDQKDFTSRVYVSFGGQVRGYFSIKKQYRSGLNTVISKLKEVYALYLLSGDNESDKKELGTMFGNEQHLHFNQTPESKLKYIQKWQHENKNVLMTGDGLNDAGALKQADVGIAVSDNVYTFSPACDAILDAQSFDKLPDFIALSKRSMKIVRISFMISLTYNTIGLLFAVQGLVTPLFAAILMPLSSVTVVSFVTLATNVMGKKLRD